MAPRSDWTIWQARWNALDSVIIGWRDSYQTSTVPFRKNIIYPLLARLEKFAGGLFGFFYDNFSNGRFTPSVEYPPEAIFAAILDQAAYDLQVIRQAADQRVTLNEMESALSKADKLAYLALFPAKQAGLLPEIPVIATYFQKSPSIRVIPYADIALIGIPFSAMSVSPALPVSRDNLAIPHEAGHYVYWRGLRDGTLIRESLRIWCETSMPRGNDEYDQVRKWSDEAFADVYGGLVAGPVMAQSSQDIARQVPLDKFMADDGDHPLPILRPHILTKVLQACGFGVAKTLDSQYVSHRSTWSSNLPASKSDETLGTIRKLVGFQLPANVMLVSGWAGDQSHDYTALDSQKPVDKIVLKYLDFLKDVKPNGTTVRSNDDAMQAYARGDFSRWWLDYLNKPGADLYKQLENHLNALPDGITLSNTLPTGDLDNLWTKWLGDNFPDLAEGVSLKDNLWTDWLHNYVEDLAEGVPLEKWWPVFLAGGWTTKGGNKDPLF